MKAELSLLEERRVTLRRHSDGDPVAWVEYYKNLYLEQSKARGRITSDYNLLKKYLDGKPQGYLMAKKSSLFEFLVKYGIGFIIGSAVTLFICIAL